MMKSMIDAANQEAYRRKKLEAMAKNADATTEEIITVTQPTPTAGSPILVDD